MERLIKESQLREILGCSPSTVWRFRLLGMPYLCIGRQYRYELPKVLEWLEKQTEEKAEQRKKICKGKRK